MRNIRLKKVGIIILLVFLSASASKLFFGRGIPFVYRAQCWSIGIYTGTSPFSLSPSEDIVNPVMTAEDVTDIPARFVADPFMVKENNKWYMFFEVMNKETNQGDIGFAVSEDGLHWKYQQIILDETFHLSYPYIFKWDNEYFMIPESYEAGSIRLYKAVNFPTKWSFEKVLIKGKNYVDSSIFRFKDKWWLFTSTPKNDILYLYYTDNLTGTWVLHPKSPVIKGNANISRPGGRVLVVDGRIIRYAQDDEPTYGNQVYAFEITELSTMAYKEKRLESNPALKDSGTGWNKDGMHHIDLHQTEKNKWIACVDGFYKSIVFGLTK